MLNDKSNHDNEKLEFKTLSAELYPLISSIRGNTFFIKTIIETDELANNHASVLQMLERILEATEDLEKIRLNLKGIATDND